MEDNISSLVCLDTSGGLLLWNNPTNNILVSV